MSSETTVGLTQADIESLRALRSSPHWQLYRKMLIAQKDAKFLAILPKTDTNEVFKAMGEIAGLNQAINQIGMIVDAHDKKMKEAADKAGNRKGQTQAAQPI